MTDVLDKHLSTLFGDPSAPEGEPTAPPETDGSLPSTDESTADSPVVPEPPPPGAVPGPPETIEEAPAGEPAQPATGIPVQAAPIDYQKIAEARLQEINSVRRALRRSKEENEAKINRLSAEMADMRKYLPQPDAIDPALLESDPILRNISNRLNAAETELVQRRAAEREIVEFQRETQEIVRYGQESRAAFVSHTPEWQDAYGYVREQYAAHLGLTNDPQREAKLNLEEHEATKAWMENGEDPALKIYEMATALGWRPTAGSGQAAVAGQPAPGVPGQARTSASIPSIPAANPGRVRRVREAINAPSPSAIGQRDAGRDVLTREQFYEQYSEPERIRIYNSSNGEDVFEHLAKTGQVPISLLGSPR